MLGAAPTCKRPRGVVLGFVSVVVGVATLVISAGNASAEVHSASAQVAPVWGVALDGRQADQPNLELLAQAKAAGVNAIVTDPKRWSTERHHRLVSLARGLGMFLIEPRRPSTDVGSPTELRARCKAGLRVHRPCAFVATSPREAVELARRGTVDYVVVRLGSPTDFELINATRSTRTQLITVITVGESAKLDATWDQAIDSAVRNPETTLATGLSGAFAATAIRDYFRLLDKHAAGAPTFDNSRGRGGDNGNGQDRLPPTTPLGASVTSVSSTSVGLSWTASTDNVGVAGYGIHLGGTSIGSTTSTNFTVTGLQCGSVYTFEIDAYDRRGNRSQRIAVTGSTSSCPLPPPPPPPSDRTDRVRPSRPDGLAASGVMQSTMTLTWRASTDNVGVAGYEVFKGTESVATTTSTSYLLAGLSCGTTYALSVRAYDAAGNDSKPAAIPATTAPCSTPSPSPDTQAPTIPGNVHLIGTTVSSITLAWNVSSDNVGVAGYGVYRNGTLAGSTNTTSYTVAGLACGTNYTLAVDAYDTAGNHSQRATITTSTSSCPPAGDTQAPTVPTNVRAAGATPTSITIAWASSIDNVGVTGYTVFSGASAVGNTTSTSYTVLGLSCGATYTLAVDAYDAAGNRSAKASVTASTSACPPPPPSADTQAPTVPGGLRVTGATANSITVAWTASTDNVAVTGYGLYRDGTSIGTAASTSATFSGLSCGTGYTLAVDAYDAAGNRSSKASVSATTSACAPPPPSADTQAPTMPGGLRVTGATASSITVAWTASTDNVGVTGYGLYRGGTSTGTTASTSATFSGLSCGTGYTLAVDAYDAAGNRSAKASISSPTSACPPPPPTADTQAPTVPGGLHATGATASSITVAWTASTDNVGVTGYGLYRNGASTGTSASLSATFSGLSCGTGYTLAVDAYDAAGNRSAKASVTASTSACPPAADTQAPTVPGGLRVTGATANSITVAWTASTDNVGVTGYGVYNGSSSVGSTASTSYTVSGLSCATGYTVAVDAYDAAGNRSGRSSISAPTAACTPSGTGAYISANGNDSTCVRGDQSKPCLTFNRAYQVARCGETVFIAGGSYGSQTISYDATKDACGSQIKFVLATAATVNLSGSMTFRGARHVSVVSPSTSRFVVAGSLNVVPNSATQYPIDVTVSNIDFGGRYEIQSTQNSTISHNDFGPTVTSPTSNGEPEFWYNTSGAPNNSGITFEYNFVHDFTSTGGAHTSCGLVSYLTNSVIRGNTFVRCDNEGLLVKADGSGVSYGGTYLQNITFESNVFAAACSTCGVGPDAGLSFNTGGGQGNSSAPYSGFVIRNNSFHDPVGFNAPNTFFTNGVFTGNILPRTKDSRTGATCANGLNSSYNLFVGAAPPTCGANASTTATYPYVNAVDTSSLNYHLAGAKGSTAADNMVPMSVPGGCASFDIDGSRRPIDANCESGAHER